MRTVISFTSAFREAFGLDNIHQQQHQQEEQQQQQQRQTYRHGEEVMEHASLSAEHMLDDESSSSSSSRTTTEDDAIVEEIYVDPRPAIEHDKKEFFRVDFPVDASVPKDRHYYEGLIQMYQFKYDSLKETTERTIDNLEDAKQQFLEQHIEELRAAIPQRSLQSHYSCLSEKDQLVQCLQANKGDMLKCHTLAQQFVRCSTSSKAAFLGQKDL